MSSPDCKSEANNAGSSGAPTPTRPISALTMAELSRRPSRQADHATENRALIDLAGQFTASPEVLLQKVTEAALKMCGAQSAGISLLERDGRRFYWPALAGQWAEHIGGGTPRDYGPCGAVLDADAPLLFLRPERDFDYLQSFTPMIEEGLLVPLRVRGKAIGTIWAIMHDATSSFEAEDLRLLTDLAEFVAPYYQAVTSLQEMEGLASIVESSEDAIITKDLNGIIRTWNPAAERLFGYSAEEAVGKSVGILIPTRNEDEEPVILDKIRRGQRVDHYETTRVRKDGSEVHISLTVSPIKEPFGKIIGASKIARDVTERRWRDRQFETLAREAEHRTKNVLSTVQAVVRLSQADSAGSLKEVIEGRILALSQINSLFVQSRWAGARLDDIIRQEMAPYARDGEPRVHFDILPVMLQPDSAQAVAVTLHELATNAAKYGALAEGHGQVRIVASQSPDGRTVTLRWAETGGPRVTAPTLRGFGTRVMASMARQSGADIAFDWRPEGLQCELKIPLQDHADGNAAAVDDVPGAPGGEVAPKP